MEVTTPGISATEPSTPIRSSSPAHIHTAGSHTDPNRPSRGVGIPLPPHDIPRLSFTLAQEEARRAERRSKRDRNSAIFAESGLRPGSAPRSRSRSRRNSLILDPRLSGDFAQRVKRRRRSSIIDADRQGKRIANPGYVEPITANYLKFFCQILVAERNKSVKSDSGNPPAHSPPRPRSSFSITYSEVNPEDEFNSSLPLPSNTHPLLSPLNQPDIHTGFSRQSPVLFEETRLPSPEPRTFSYLERILASQGPKQPAPAGSSYTFDPQSYKTPASKVARSPAGELSPFRINDSQSIKTGDAQSLHEDTNEELDKGNKDASEAEYSIPERVQQDSPVLEAGIAVNDVHLDDIDFDHGVHDFNDIPDTIDRLSPIEVPTGAETASIASPLALSSPPPSVIHTPERSFRDVLGFSPSIIQEEFTLLDAENVPDIIAPESDDENRDTNSYSNIDSNLDTNQYSDAGDHLQTTPAPTLKFEGRIPNARTPPDSDSSLSFPIAMIRKMVRASRTTAFETQNNLVPLVRSKTRLRPEVYKQISIKSGEFILSMMGDIEAYARHRSPSNYQITIKDVLLYLHRIRFIRNDSDEIDTVARLAHSVLPTETLIALDNSIASAAGPSSSTQDDNEAGDLYFDDDGSGSLDDLE